MFAEDAWVIKLSHRSFNDWLGFIFCFEGRDKFCFEFVQTAQFVAGGMKSPLFDLFTLFISVQGFFLENFSEAYLHAVFVGVGLTMIAQTLEKVGEFIAVFVGSISQEIFFAGINSLKTIEGCGVVLLGESLEGGFMLGIDGYVLVVDDLLSDMFEI